MLAPLREAGKAAVIPPKRSRTEQRAYDRDRDQARHLIEDFSCKLKQYRAIAARHATPASPSPRTERPRQPPAGVARLLAACRSTPPVGPYGTMPGPNWALNAA